MLVLSVFALLLFFYLGLFFGQQWYSKSGLLANLGKKLYDQKTQQLEHSPLFKPLRSLDKKSNFTKGFVLVFVLIFLKSLAFYFIGLILIVPIVLLVQGVMMGSLFKYHEKHIGSIWALKKITIFQLLSHIALASLGLWTGFKWLYLKEITFTEGLNINKPLILAALLALVFAVIAAWLEICYLKNNKHN